MSLRARFDKLEPRERRLLTILGAVFVAGVILAIPITIWSTLSTRREANDELRVLIESIYEGKATVSERKAKRDALLARYAKSAPQLAGFLDELAKANGLSAAESQDKPIAHHGKRYTERATTVKMHKVGMLQLVKLLEKIEQSGHPVVITKLSIKPRSGEPDSYEVELGVSAFDRKADAPTGASSATPAAEAPSAEPDTEEEP